MRIFLASPKKAPGRPCNGRVTRPRDPFRVLVLKSAAFALACRVICGQATGADPAFEAASVKPAVPGAPGFMSLQGGPGTDDPGRIGYTNVTLRVLVGRAYDVLDDQISGPSWLGAERYDVAATLASGATEDQLRKMLQNLLTERFKLALHRERKDLTVYELKIAKGGPKLREGPLAADVKPAKSERGAPVDGNGFPEPPAHQTAQRSVSGVAKMAANQITMEAFAQFLRFPMGFVRGDTIGRVVDQTGLRGEYSFTLEYQWPGPAPVAGGADSAPSIFDALQQQLGLGIEQTRQPFDVLVIDRAEKTPVEN